MSVTIQRNIFRISALCPKIRPTKRLTIPRRVDIQGGFLKSISSTYSTKYSNFSLNKYESSRVISLYNRSFSNEKSPRSTTDEKNKNEASQDLNTNAVQGTAPTKLSLYQRFKQMYKEYWYVLLPVHVATSVVWFGGFYYLAVSGVDVIHLLEVIGTPQSWIDPLKNSKASGLVSAYTMYKVATPARYTVTLGGTTVSINYLKKWGWIKPIPNAEKLKEMYHVKKDAFLDMKDVYQDKLKDEIKKTVSETKDEIIKTKHQIKQGYLEAKQGFQHSSIDSKQSFKVGMSYAVGEWTHVFRLFSKAFTTKLKEFTAKKKKEE